MDNSAFKKFSSSKEVLRAIDVYQDKPFNVAQEKAQQGDRQAQLYLISLCMGVLVNVFVKNYARRNKGADAYSDGSYEFLANLVTHLIEITKERKGPFYTFNASKYGSVSDTFVINKFRYYMMRTAEHVARKMTKENYEKDMPVSDTEAVNDGEYEDKIASLPDPITTTEYTNNKIETNDVYDRFEQVIRNKSKSNMLLVVYKYLRQGMSATDIADEMGVSRQYVHQIITKLKNIYQTTKEVA